MKTAILCGSLLAAGSAMAQQTAVADWAGPYAGISLSAPSADVEDNLDSTQVFSFSAKGTVTTAQAGYNFQRGGLVYGIEGSISSGSVDGIGECLGCLGSGSQPNMEIGQSAALRARVGLARNNVLYFATLGTGYAKASVQDPFQGGNDSQKHRAVLAGVGVDWKFSDRMSAGAEYIVGRYDDVPYALVTIPDIIGFETQELRLGVKLSF